MKVSSKGTGSGAQFNHTHTSKNIGYKKAYGVKAWIALNYLE